VKRKIYFAENDSVKKKTRSPSEETLAGFGAFKRPFSFFNCRMAGQLLSFPSRKPYFPKARKLVDGV